MSPRRRSTRAKTEYTHGHSSPGPLREGRVVPQDNAEDGVRSLRLLHDDPVEVQSPECGAASLRVPAGHMQVDVPEHVSVSRRATASRVLGELPKRVALREGGRLEGGVHGAVDGAEDAADGEGRAWGHAHRYRDVAAVVHRGHAGHRAEVQPERLEVARRLERGEEQGQRGELGGRGVEPHVPVERHGRQGWVESKEGLRRERESW